MGGARQKASRSARTGSAIFRVSAVLAAVWVVYALLLVAVPGPFDVEILLLSALLVVAPAAVVLLIGWGIRRALDRG